MVKWFSRRHESKIGPEWHNVAGSISGMLQHLLAADPESVGGPYARFVLRNDWTVYFANDRREPDARLMVDDVCCAFVHEDRELVRKLIADLRGSKIPMFQQAAIESFAKAIVRKLASRSQ